MNQQEKQALIEEIAIAWEDVVYPGDSNIFTRDSYDDEGITEYFSGTTWSGHSPEALRAYDSAISVFFTKEAFHYWLPAFLIASLEDPEELSQGVDALVNSFIPPEKEWKANEFSSRMSLLTNEQKQKVITVIEYLSELYFDERYPDSIFEEEEALRYLYENTSMA